MEHPTRDDWDPAPDDWNPAPAYWPTRILLAVGFVATAVVLAWPILAAQMYASTMQPMFDPRLSILGLPASVVVSLAADAPVLVGLAWMVRIFRGPRDEAPAWRYRDR